MAYYMHLQNLRADTTLEHLSYLFPDVPLPEAAVNLIGGPAGEAFITFKNQGDLERSLQKNGQLLMGQHVVLKPVSQVEKEKAIQKMYHDALLMMSQPQAPSSVAPSQSDRYSRAAPAAVPSSYQTSSRMAPLPERKIDYGHAGSDRYRANDPYSDTGRVMDPYGRDVDRGKSPYGRDVGMRDSRERYAEVSRIRDPFGRDRYDEGRERSRVRDPYGETSRGRDPYDANRVSRPRSTDPYARDPYEKNRVGAGDSYSGRSRSTREEVIDLTDEDTLKRKRREERRDSRRPSRRRSRSRSRSPDRREKRRKRRSPSPRRRSRSRSKSRSTRTSPAPETKEGGGPCFLVLYSPKIVSDTTATEVWTLFDGSSGPAVSVTVIHRTTGPATHRDMAFVEFADPLERENAEDMYDFSVSGEKRKDGKSNLEPHYTLATTSRFLARLPEDCKVTKSSAEGKDVEVTMDERKQGEFTLLPSLTQSSGVFYMQTKALPLKTTACEVWGWFGGDTGSAEGGVLLVEKSTGNAQMASVSFKNIRDRVKALDSKSKWVKCKGDKLMDTFARRMESCDIKISTEFGHDREVNVNEQKLLTKRADLLPPFKPCCLKLRKVPAGANASEIWGWYDAARGDSQKATLVRDPQGVGWCAFLWFEEESTRDKAIWKRQYAKKFSADDAYRYLARLTLDYQILESSDLGNDWELSSKERLKLQMKIGMKPTVITSDTPENLQKLKDDLLLLGKDWVTDRPEQEEVKVRPHFTLLESSRMHYVRVETVPVKTTATEVWSWFDGKKGPAEGAFVVVGKHGFVTMAGVAFESESSSSLTKKNREIMDEIAKAQKNSAVKISTQAEQDRMVNRQEKRLLLRMRKGKPVVFGVRRPKTRAPRVVVEESSEEEEEMEEENSVEEKPFEKPEELIRLLGDETTIYYRFVDLPKSITACKMWKVFNSEEGPCTGVVLVRDTKGAMLFAYAGFTEEPTAFLHRFEEENYVLSSWKVRNNELAVLDSSAMVLESTDLGIDDAVSNEIRLLFARCIQEQERKEEAARKKAEAAQKKAEEAQKKEEEAQQKKEEEAQQKKEEEEQEQPMVEQENKNEEDGDSDATEPMSNDEDAEENEMETNETVETNETAEETVEAPEVVLEEEAPGAMVEEVVTEEVTDVTEEVTDEVTNYQDM